MVWEQLIDNIPNISEQTLLFISSDGAMVPLLILLGYATQARGSQFMEVSWFNYILKLIYYLDDSPSQV